MLQSLPRSLPGLYLVSKLPTSNAQFQPRDARGIEPDAFMQKVAAQDFCASAVGLPRALLPVGPAPPAHDDAHAAGQGEWFASLARLMQWRGEGLLTEQEFEVAKERMGLSPGR